MIEQLRSLQKRLYIKYKQTSSRQKKIIYVRAYFKICAYLEYLEVNKLTLSEAIQEYITSKEAK